MKSFEKSFSAGIYFAIVAVILPRPPFAFPSEKQKVIQMAHLPDDYQGFSFQAGKLIPLRANQRFSLDIDLVWDPQTGLYANNESLYFAFQGKGGIIDLGKQRLSAGNGVPKEGYEPYLKAGRIKVGHAYAIRTADGKRYGEIHVIKYDPERKVLDFSWKGKRKAVSKK
jgi:hypothetical protein